MIQTAVHPPTEEIVVENAYTDEEIESLEREFEGSYIAPDAEVKDVEETEDQVVPYIVLIAVLLTLALTLAAAVSIYCINKGGSLVFWTKINAFEVRVGCTQ